MESSTSPNITTERLDTTTSKSNSLVTDLASIDEGHTHISKLTIESVTMETSASPNSPTYNVDTATSKLNSPTIDLAFIDDEDTPITKLTIEPVTIETSTSPNSIIDDEQLLRQTKKLEIKRQYRNLHKPLLSNPKKHDDHKVQHTQLQGFPKADVDSRAPHGGMQITNPFWNEENREDTDLEFITPYVTCGDHVYPVLYSKVMRLFVIFGYSKSYYLFLSTKMSSQIVVIKQLKLVVSRERDSYCNIPSAPNFGVKPVRYPVNDTVAENVVVTFSCLDSNHTLEAGPSNITCQSDGNWAGVPNQPACLEKCDNPGQPGNGRQDTSPAPNYHAFTSVTFSCDDGYSPVGSASISCVLKNYDPGESAVQWSGDIPQCKASCSDLSTPYNGSVSPASENGTYLHGSVVHVSCDLNFTLVGSDESTCNNGEWTSAAPTCAAPCEDPRSLLGNGTVTVTSYMHDGGAEYSCNDGFTLNGAVSSTCVYGVWQPQRPVCNDNNECDIKRCINGDCIDRINNFTCDCDVGYTGYICDNEIDECDPDPCQNSGTCTDLIAAYKCNCADGYNGTNCEIEIDECDSDPCQNGGTCTDLIAAYKCNCTDGYNGTNCEIEIDDCDSDPCQNGGTCTDLITAYKCNCTDGYNGTNCEIEINECDPDPCQNGGTCTDLIAAYKCNCTDGYNGTNCEIVSTTLPPTIVYTSSPVTPTDIQTTLLDNATMTLESTSAIISSTTHSTSMPTTKSGTTEPSSNMNVSSETLSPETTTTSADGSSTPQENDTTHTSIMSTTLTIPPASGTQASTLPWTTLPRFTVNLQSTSPVENNVTTNATTLEITSQTPVPTTTNVTSRESTQPMNSTTVSPTNQPITATTLDSSTQIPTDNMSSITPPHSTVTGDLKSTSVKSTTHSGQTIQTNTSPTVVSGSTAQHTVVSESSSPIVTTPHVQSTITTPAVSTGTHEAQTTAKDISQETPTWSGETHTAGHTPTLVKTTTGTTTMAKTTAAAIPTTESPVATIAKTTAAAIPTPEAPSPPATTLTKTTAAAIPTTESPVATIAKTTAAAIPTSEVPSPPATTLTKTTAAAIPTTESPVATIAKTTAAAIPTTESLVATTITKTTAAAIPTTKSPVATTKAKTTVVPAASTKPLITAQTGVNECAQNPSPCTGPHTQCIDKVNGYECVCKPSYFENNDICKRSKTFKVVLIILKFRAITAEYISDYDDPYSGPYSIITEIILDEIDTVLKNEFPGTYYGSAIISYFEGSVGVNAVTYLDESTDTTADQLQEVLTDAISEEGLIGDLTIEQDSIDVSGFEDSACARPSGNDCSLDAQCKVRGDSFTCACKSGYEDVSPDPSTRPGRDCSKKDSSYLLILAISLGILGGVLLIALIVFIIICIRVTRKQKGKRKVPLPIAYPYGVTQPMYGWLDGKRKPRMASDEESSEGYEETKRLARLHANMVHARRERKDFRHQPNGRRHTKHHRRSANDRSDRHKRRNPESLTSHGPYEASQLARSHTAKEGQPSRKIELTRPYRLSTGPGVGVRRDPESEFITPYIATGDEAALFHSRTSKVPVDSGFEVDADEQVQYMKKSFQLPDRDYYVPQAHRSSLTMDDQFGV
uniref:Uncharacterized protein LOC102801595 n=1 Tax=Saccoglossus kowalevskii TaxID=10224 RepID=A0ABM0M4L1_SACKO|nr:PREDICTED: uncharacterized protein LOC102801595 [Saccoglossus kowalevskii]